MNFFDIAGLLFVCVAGLIIVTNWIGILIYVFSKRRFSTIPLIGGLLGAIGLLFFDRSRNFFWIALIIDPGFWTAARFLLHSLRCNSTA